MIKLSVFRNPGLLLFFLCLVPFCLSIACNGDGNGDGGPVASPTVMPDIPGLDKELQAETLEDTSGGSGVESRRVTINGTIPTPPPANGACALPSHSAFQLANEGCQ